jgi:hypothetical protein
LMFDPQFRDELFDGPASGFANNIPDKKNFHW